MPRYRPAILDALAAHGLAPRPQTPPRALRDQVNDLYRYEIRRLRDRCRAGEFPTAELAGHVVELRRRYLLLSVPLDRWVDADR
ncbi:MAG: hypothetical protein AB7U83_06590 [Vicinamibacterales bacterium]